MVYVKGDQTKAFGPNIQVKNSFYTLKQLENKTKKSMQHRLYVSQKA